MDERQEIEEKCVFRGGMEDGEKDKFSFKGCQIFAVGVSSAIYRVKFVFADAP